MRSALTDAPDTSFTTMLLRATQHATGLMVKVAPLLPSRDLLSSQRQLRWTHTKVFAKAGLDNQTSAICKHQQLSGQTSFNLALVINFNFIFSIGHLYRAGRAMNSLPSQILNVSCNIRFAVRYNKQNIRISTSDLIQTFTLKLVSTL